MEYLFIAKKKSRDGEFTYQKNFQMNCVSNLAFDAWISEGFYFLIKEFYTFYLIYFTL